MKQLPIFLLLFFIWYSTASLAQAEAIAKPKYVFKGSENMVGIGFASGETEGNAAGGYKSYDIRHYSGTPYIKYHYHRNKRWSYGAILAYENDNGIWNKVTIYGIRRYDNLFLGSYKRQALTFSPEITFNYWDIHHGLVRFYGTLGLGISYRNEIDTYDSTYFYSKYTIGINSLGNNINIDNSRYFVNYYFSFFGVHVGRKLGAFWEVGLGYKGLVSIGLSYKY